MDCIPEEDEGRIEAVDLGEFFTPPRIGARNKPLPTIPWNLGVDVALTAATILLSVVAVELSWNVYELTHQTERTGKRIEEAMLKAASQDRTIRIDDALPMMIREKTGAPYMQQPGLPRHLGGTWGRY